VDTDFNVIQVFKVNSSKYSGYIAIISQKTAVFENIKDFKTGGIFLSLANQ